MSKSPLAPLSSDDTASLERREAWRLNLGQSKLPLTGPRQDDWWTGPKPPPWTQVTLSALPPPSPQGASRSEVAAYFDNGWLHTELLFAALQGDEAFYRPPGHQLRHPLIFYYAHPATFYVNKLRLAGLLPAGLEPELETLFETGVDEMAWDDMAKNALPWPTVDAVRDYRQKVYRAVGHLIQVHPDLAAGSPLRGQEHPLWALFMAFEHERIHLETSSVLIRELPLRLVRRPEGFAPLAPSGVKHGGQNQWLPVAAGAVRIGKEAAADYFGWDNEYGQRDVELPAFSAQQQLVSNGEFLRFVAAGGYQDESFWSEIGWRWRSFRNAKKPPFWVASGPAGTHQYQLRTLFEVTDMAWQWPVIVNYHEAAAYGRWLTSTELPTDGDERCRLPSEAEQQLMRQGARVAEALPPSDANVGFRLSSECAATAHGPGFQDLRGNLWQWSEDHFHPLPGFRVHRLYDDFSAPCFDGEHQVILGGSFASAGDEALASARFHFRPHFVQHAGFRLVRAAKQNDGAAIRLKTGGLTLRLGDLAADSYESDALLAEYLLLHFGAVKEQMPYEFGPVAAAAFPQRCAELCLTWAKKLDIPVRRALDIGCAVGGATFRLAEVATEVAIGIDLSERFIAAAQTLQVSGQLPYLQKREGELGDPAVAKVAAASRQRAEFRRADAASLPPDFIDFDVVLVANLLCRMPSPASLLRRLGAARGVVRKGGILVFTTPFTWMEKFTPKESWLGGRDSANGPQWSDAGLIAELGDEFELLERRPMPLVIREHIRKFQYIVPDGFVFRRRL